MRFWQLSSIQWSITRRAWVFRWASTGLLLLILGCLVSEQWLPAVYWRAQDDVHDALVRQQLQHPRARVPEQRITIIDIDESSLEIFGSWPWSRSLTAQLIEGLAKHQPKVIGLDIVFPDVTTHKDDRRLTQVILQHPVVLAQAFDLNPISTPPQAGLLAGGVARSDSDRRDVVAHGFIANYPAMVNAMSHHSRASCAGHITPSPSADGVVRHIAPWITYQDQRYPMLAWALVDCASRASVPSAVWQDREAALSLSQGQWRFPWAKALDAYTVVSAKEVLASQVSADVLKDRYVLIGSSALGIGDRVASPVAPWLPGVMVHAEILTELLNRLETGQGRLLPQGGHTRSLALVYGLATLLLMSLLLYRKNLLWCSGMLVVVVGNAVGLRRIMDCELVVAVGDGLVMVAGVCAHRMVDCPTRSSRKSTASG